MDFNKSKMKNITAWLEVEPNFPCVATPQSSEWIIYVISYTYHPFTAPWGVMQDSIFAISINLYSICSENNNIKIKIIFFVVTF